MKARFVLALVFVLGLGTSGYYTQTASAAPASSCCGGDPGAPVPPHTPQVPNPIPLPTPPSTK